MRKFLLLFLMVILANVIFGGCQDEYLADNDSKTPLQSNIPLADPITNIDTKYDPILNYDDEQLIIVDDISNKGFLVKSKKMPQADKNDDVLILSVENLTDENYTIVITVTFFDTEVEIVRRLSKKFEGFPAHWQNHFIFLPKTTYNSIKYQIEVSEFTDVTYAQYIAKNQAPVNLSIMRARLDGSEILDDWYTQSMVRFQAASTCEKELYIGYETILFDNQGKIYHYNCIPNTRRQVRKPDEGVDHNIMGVSHVLELTDILWKNQEEYVWPDNLTGDLIGLISITAVSTEQQ